MLILYYIRLDYAIIFYDSTFLLFYESLFMRKPLIALLLGAVVMVSCKTYSSADALPAFPAAPSAPAAPPLPEAWQAALCQPDAEFPASTALTAEDAAVEKQFGAACLKLRRLEGLRFKEAHHAYYCESFLATQEGSPDSSLPSPATVEKAFGGKEALAKADILARQGMMGKAFSAIILTNSQNEPDAMVLRRDVLSPLLAGIDSPAAAAAWSFLQNLFGTIGFRPQALCHATITTTESGWEVSNAEVMENCKPTEILHFSLSKTGKIAIHSRDVKKNPDGTIRTLCVD
jgi:hypothetical protein